MENLCDPDDFLVNVVYHPIISDPQPEEISPALSPLQSFDVDPGPAPEGVVL